MDIVTSVIQNVRTDNKHGKLVVKPSYEYGTFDSHAVDCPFVFRYEGRFLMTFVGWDSIGYRTGIAESDDLVSWKKIGMIIDRGPEDSITEFNVALTSILRDNDLFGPGELRKVDGKFVGTYHAYPGKGYEVGAGVIGLCYSDDLMNWKIGDPVLLPEESNTWESGGLYKSWLMEKDGTFYLFYNAKNITTGNWKEKIGFAYSDDLCTWKKYYGNPILSTGLPGSFDDRFASDPCIFQYDDIWLLFYFGASSDGHARDSVAYSTDFLSWNKTNIVLIDIGQAGSIDSKYAHKPSMIAKNNTLYHFYCAVSTSEGRNTGTIETNEIRGISFAKS